MTRTTPQDIVNSLKAIGIDAKYEPQMGGGTTAIAAYDETDAGMRQMLITAADDESGMTTGHAPYEDNSAFVAIGIYDHESQLVTSGDASFYVIDLRHGVGPEDIAAVAHSMWTDPANDILRRADALEAATNAFWETVAKHYPDITTGDFPPDAGRTHDLACERAITDWLGFNAEGPANRVAI